MFPNQAHRDQICLAPAVSKLSGHQVRLPTAVQHRQVLSHLSGLHVPGQALPHLSGLCVTGPDVEGQLRRDACLQCD